MFNVYYWNPNSQIRLNEFGNFALENPRVRVDKKQIAVAVASSASERVERRTPILHLGASGASK